MRIFGAIVAALFGLAFGSFLNVCLTRWTANESVVSPPSHCRNCQRSLAWWENIPLLSYLFLRGRCRTCGAAIGIRYLIVELAVGALWALQAYRSLPVALYPAVPAEVLGFQELIGICFMALFWVLIALAVLDIEHLWLPDRIIWPGIAAGLLVSIASLLWELQLSRQHEIPASLPLSRDAFFRFGGLVVGGSPAVPVLVLLATPLLSAAPLLLIRWGYQLVRHRQGMGPGDVKLMALLGAWLGLPYALVALFFGIVIGGAAAAILLLKPDTGRPRGALATARLPFGAFLCVGGILSALWGGDILRAYLKLAGF